MKIILVSKSFLDIEQYVEFKMSVLISPSKSLISLRWVTYKQTNKILNSSISAKDSLSLYFYFHECNIGPH